MKRYRLRDDSILYKVLIAMMLVTVLIIIPGLGNHYIDGIY